MSQGIAFAFDIRSKSIMT